MKKILLILIISTAFTFSAFTQSQRDSENNIPTANKNTDEIYKNNEIIPAENGTETEIDGDETDDVSSAEKIMNTFSSDENPDDELEEFNFPEEKKLVKNVIKADLGSPFSMGLFTVYNLLPTKMIRTPLMWDYAFSKYVSLQINIEEVSYFIVPSALGIAAGFSVFPLGKAPYDLYLSVRGGATVGLFYAATVQAGLGWQFILKNDFVISLGTEFAWYYENSDSQFYIPTISIGLGWGF